MAFNFSHATAFSPFNPLGASAGAGCVAFLAQGISPSFHEEETSRLKKAVVASAKKCTPLTARLDGVSRREASLWERSKCRAARASALARSGLVAAMQEALKRVATAPTALGAAEGVEGSQV